MESKFEDNLTRSRETGQDTIIVMYYVAKLSLCGGNVDERRGLTEITVKREC